jgi:hypothetical protein
VDLVRRSKNKKEIMFMSIEQFLDNITLEELEELRKLKESNTKVPTYSFSKMTESLLNSIVDIEEKYDNVFDDWFNSVVLDQETETFLEKLLSIESNNIKSYNEEDLKMKFLSPIFTHINFTNLEYKFRDFYEYSLEYKSDNFILSGVTDFVLSKGIKYIQKPYFFVQEFKKSKVVSDPEPQLLAELISAVELNNWKSIRGAYIVGAIWNFVILERLEKHKYQYYVSQNFDSTKIEDLKDIYKNLVFVKNEIIEMIKEEQKVS